MGIFNRLGSLFRANVDDLISRSEDPEKMLNQVLHEMSYQLVEVRKRIVVAVADERRFRAQWEAEVEQTRHWKQRAAMAVRAGDDQLAKEALLRRREHEGLAEEFQKQWEAQRQGVDQLKTAFHRLDAQVREAKRKKGLLLAKKRRAEAQQLIQQTLSGLTDDSALETLSRIEHRIDQVEAEADAQAELNEQMTGDVLNQRFAALEAGEVDLDLLELKQEMGLIESGSHSADPLPSAERERSRLEGGRQPVYVESELAGVSSAVR